MPGSNVVFLNLEQSIYLKTTRLWFFFRAGAKPSSKETIHLEISFPSSYFITMLCMGGSTIFNKKSSGNLRRKVHGDQAAMQHLRSASEDSNMSSSSSISYSSEHRGPASYDPLSLHPPLSMNASPCLPEHDEDSGYGENNRQYATMSTVDESPSSSAEPSPTMEEGRYYFKQDTRRERAVYNSAIRSWPLQDWQPIALEDMRMGQNLTPQSQAGDQRRPPTEESEADMFIRRGDWKRRGVIFHPDVDDQEEEEPLFLF